jgi:hypothetical protein
MNRQNPITYKEVTPYVIPSPVGIDKVITNLQVALAANLSWLEKSFGKANKTIKQEDDREFIFPSILTEVSKDEIPLLGNDNFNAYSYFLADGEELPINYEEHAVNQYQRPISLTFWMDLKRVDSTKLYNFKEELIREVKKVISTTNVGNGNDVEILSVVTDPELIFDGYSTDLMKSQMLTYPQVGFRIDLLAYYQGEENC